jgi:hypothetical protein
MKWTHIATRDLRISQAIMPCTRNFELRAAGRNSQAQSCEQTAPSSSRTNTNFPADYLKADGRGADAL